MKARLVVLPAALVFCASISYAQETKRHASLPVATRDGKRIAFQSDRTGKSQIYTMNADGTGERRLTSSSTDDFGPDWSPDGKWLVFASYVDESSPMQIVAIRSDGSGRRIVATSKEASWPRISPDGRKVAFTGIDKKGKRAIYIVEADGSRKRAFPAGLAEAWNPEWSPDGRQLLFTSFPEEVKNPARSTTTIYIAELSGKNRRRAATVPGIAQLPRWSADGRMVALQTYTAKGIADIIVVDIATGKAATVTHRDRPYLDETPAWLPDGRLLFQSTRDGTFEVYRMNADGSSQKRISR